MKTLFEGLVGLLSGVLVLFGIFYVMFSCPPIFIIGVFSGDFTYWYLLIPGVIGWLYFLITGFAEIGRDVIRDIRR